MNNSKPTVSVIIPVFNSENYISEAINSVIDQTYEEIEIIVINDCSKDDSLIKINSCIGISTRRIIVENLKENKGQGFSRNLGISLATGDYIAFLDSDDVWKENKLESQLIFMQKTNCNFSYTNLAFINEFGETIKSRLSLVIEKVDYNDLLKNNFIATSTVIIL